jgi:hypothetical protein
MSRRTLLAVLCALAAAGAVGSPAATVAHASADDDGAADVADVLLTDPGAGFTLAGEQRGVADSLTRTWSGPEGELTMTGFVVTDPPGHEVMFEALAQPNLGLALVPEPSLQLADWLVPRGGAPGDRGVAHIVVASRDHLFSIQLKASPSTRLDPVAFVLDLAHRQVDAAGGQPSSGAAESEPRQVDDDELLRYLPDQAPPGYGLGREALTMTGRDEIEAFGIQSPQVIAFVNDRTANAARAWVSDSIGVSVEVTRYPYDIFAAAGLGELDDLPPSRIDTDALRSIPGAATSRDPSIGTVAVAFRRGDLLVRVLTQFGGAVPEEVAEQLAVDTAHVVDDHLPTLGGTSPYEFPGTRSRLTGLALTAAFVTAAVGGSRAIARLRARRVRRRWAAEATSARAWPVPGTAPGAVVELDDDAAALRRRGLVVAGVQLLTVDIGVVALAGDFAWPGAVVAGASMLCGVFFGRWWLRREHALLGPKAPPKAFVAPRLSGAVVGLTAFAVLGIGVGFMFKGMRYVAFGVTLAQLRWSDLLGIAPRTVGYLFAVGGAAVAVLGAALWRFARELGRARVRRVLAADHRPPVLYLRSFSDDSLPLPIIASARRPLFELFSLRGADPFEESVAWELESYGPVVAVGRPGGSLASLGAAREHLPQETWHAEIAERMRDAGMIVLAPGETAGLAWELGEIVTGGHVGKTMFVFPPLPPGDLERRWHHTADLLEQSGTGVGPLPVPPAGVHTARIRHDGELHVTVASVRDEATYRVAVDRALEPLPRPVAHLA